MWNWNRSILDLVDAPRSTSTRTNVELKHVIDEDAPQWIGAFYSNQCGIETRLPRKGSAICTRGLLLEPMWNWNVRVRLWQCGEAVPGVSSTRTNVELKRNTGTLDLAQITITSTRTNVELKRANLSWYATRRAATSTRTNVELKLSESNHSRNQ